MKIQEDIDFLYLQQTKGCIIGVNMNLTQAEQRKHIKNEKKIVHSDNSLTCNLLLIMVK